VGDLMAKGQGGVQALYRLGRRTILPDPVGLNVWKSECIGNQQANVFGVWSIEPAQLPAHGGVEGGPQPKRRYRGTEHVQGFANEFLDVRFPGGDASDNDTLDSWLLPEADDRKSQRELPGANK